MNLRVWLLILLMASPVGLLGLSGCKSSETRAQAAEEVVDHEDPVLKAVQTIGDVTIVGNFAPTQASGVGLVCNLEGTGGATPNDEFRRLLKDQLQKARVPDAAKLLSDPDHTLVYVSARIPAGVRKGDSVEVEITLPQGAKASSLRGGYLMECPLKNFDSRRNIDKTAETDQLLMGHTLAVAKGPLLVGMQEGDDDVRLRRAVIWDGAVVLCDLQLYLYLNKDQSFAAVANAVATRINLAFPEDTQRQYQIQQAKRLQLLQEVTNVINEKMQGGHFNGHGDSAVAVNKDIVNIRIPFQYRLNGERYLLVVRNIPLRENPENAARYRARLQEMLLDPKETIRAALRLEALGKESVAALKTGLASPNVLVRFASAESLSYLGSTVGVDELIKLAGAHPLLRGPCVAALASLDESATQTRLADMMADGNPELRYGAFRALFSTNEANREIRGDLVAGSFWMHHVAITSPEPMIHFSSSRRAEIVVFGTPPALTPPFTIVAAKEFVISAAAGDDRCTVSRFVINRGVDGQRKQCALNVEEILMRMVELGGQYPELIDFLRCTETSKRIGCPILTEQLPEMVDVKLLAACGGDANQFKEHPEFQNRVLAAQRDLGLVATQTAAPTLP